MTSEKTKKVLKLIESVLIHHSTKSPARYQGAVCIEEGCKRFCMLPQSVFGKRIKIIVFVVDSCFTIDDSSLQITNGGTLSPEGLGHHFAWVIDTSDEWKTSKVSIQQCIEETALPWFRCVQTHDDYEHISQNLPDLEPIDSLDREYSFKGQSWLRSACKSIGTCLRQYSFQEIDSPYIRYVRIRGDVFHVIQLRLINDGSHFLTDVFSWIPGMHDQETSIHDDLLTICGGRLSQEGVSQTGKPWLAQDFAIKDQMMQIETVLVTQAIPWLDSIKNVDDVLENIAEPYLIMMPGIRHRLGLD
ncbi:MAG: hypothetical protein KDC35_14185 [Acidobacteria bacterium]|nr:hypothetical protein [Acidobacteriota bacterium]